MPEWELGQFKEGLGLLTFERSTGLREALCVCAVRIHVDWHAVFARFRLIERLLTLVERRAACACVARWKIAVCIVSATWTCGCAMLL